MRRVILFNLTTLDGFFEDDNGALDWFVIDQEFNEFAINQLASVDTILFGRVTYQMMASYWTTEGAIERDPIVARAMNQTSKIVFSRSLERVEWANSRLVKEKVAEEISALKQEPGKDMIIFGSAKLAATLSQNGLIDEYRVLVNPVVLGSGHPLFQGFRGRFQLKLLHTKVFSSGNVLLAYRPK